MRLPRRRWAVVTGVVLALGLTGLAGARVDPGGMSPFARSVTPGRREHLFVRAKQRRGDPGEFLDHLLVRERLVRLDGGFASPFLHRHLPYGRGERRSSARDLSDQPDMQLYKPRKSATFTRNLLTGELHTRLPMETSTRLIFGRSASSLQRRRHPLRPRLRLPARRRPRGRHLHLRPSTAPPPPPPRPPASCATPAAAAAAATPPPPPPGRRGRRRYGQGRRSRRRRQVPDPGRRPLRREQERVPWAVCEDRSAVQVRPTDDLPRHRPHRGNDDSRVAAGAVVSLTGNAISGKATVGKTGTIWIADDDERFDVPGGAQIGLRIVRPGYIGYDAVIMITTSRGPVPTRVRCIPATGPQTPAPCGQVPRGK